MAEGWSLDDWSLVDWSLEEGGSPLNQSLTGTPVTILRTATSGFFSTTALLGIPVVIRVVARSGNFIGSGLLGTVKPPTFTIIGNGKKPDYEIVNQFEANVVKVASWVDIYEADGTTIWRPKVAITEGSVSVDMSRPERRIFDLTMSDYDGSIGYGPGKFWYDKIMKPYRGIVLDNGDTWVTPLGEFYADAITRPNFPPVIQASCRDATKKLMQDKFSLVSTYPAGLNVGTIINAIAYVGGVRKFDMATVTNVTVADITYNIGDERWSAMTDLANSVGCELFFNVLGYLVFRPYVDPFTADLTYTFRTGTEGNLVNFSRATSDTFLFNDIVVHGTATENGLVYGRATNTNVNSPTNISKVGRRIKNFPSKFVASNVDAAANAAAYLKVSGLEQYDMTLESLTIPWLEAGDAVELHLPDPEPGEPTRFLLTNFTIPLGLGSMSGSAKRVTIVG